MEYTTFAQLSYFANELLRIIDEGQSISINAVCDNIEQGTIVEFIKEKYGFKNINLTLDNIKDVNLILKNKYVSEDEARNCGLNNNGLTYIIRLIIDYLTELFYDMEFNSES